jgi:hypothetical protein
VPAAVNPAPVKPAPFERRVVGPVISGAGQSVLMSFVLPRFFYCVCLEDALVFVPRPWILGGWPTSLACSATMFPFAWYYVLRASRYWGAEFPNAEGPTLAALLVGIAISFGVWIYRFVGAHNFRKRLASVPPREIPANEGPSRVELSTLRSLKTNSWRLLLVREGEEDFAFRISFLEHHEVEEALEKAYPGVFKRES